eukprot:CAMPEP_0114252872 /NCGR_PEP_ID=MMETSP0058-20121206/16081_1 /TAXON_ID=36894 /ORGANISM="Pyramimonas parkeae, CCMP726" /LENGTH=106 /DNA_ID=CAMNT_0001366861 /DNA_START=45 /DNA_END=362 /DNA_ORIENTATION=+
MTNAPNRYEKFVVPEGTKKISYVKDTKIVNAARFVIEREDHTAGNLLRMELFRDPDVVFSGYRVPHPLDPRIWLQVQTNNNSTPIEAVDTAMTELLEEYRAMKIAW